MLESSIEIFSDGGARGNPGPAACAFVVFQGDNILLEDSKYLGVTTNNVAEYNGVIVALTSITDNAELKEILLKGKIIFNMDSELVVRQLTGVYKIKDTNLMQLAMKVRNLIEVNNLQVQFNHVPRAKNAIADKLVNEKLDNSSR